MSIESDRNRVVQLQQEDVKLKVLLTKERENIRSKNVEIDSITRSITKNSTASVIQSKQKQIELKRKQLGGYEKKAVELEQKIVQVNADILKILANIEKYEVQMQKKKDKEEKNKRNIELRHTKEMTKELEKQHKIHKQLTSTSIIVDFAKLPEKITVLFIASNPEDQNKLKLEEEIRAITQKIRASEYRDSVELKSAWAVRPLDLLQIFNEHKPTIVHFSGHGSNNDELVLQNDSGETTLVSLRTIIELFRVTASGIELVVFNTCFSKNQAHEITLFIPAAIGMNTSIGDDAARVFSAQLYSAIGFGKSIGEAFGQAKVALMLENISEEETPQLFIQEGIEKNDLLLVKPAIT